MRTFDFFGLQLPYLKQETDEGPYGDRTIEVPIAELFLDLFDSSTVIELGAVLPAWSLRNVIKHTVVDLYDPYPLCVRQDIEEVDLHGKNIICISTLEHIGKAEYGNTEVDDLKAIRCFDKIVNESQNYFITIPVGFHKTLDEHLKRCNFNHAFMYEQYENEKWQLLPNIKWEYKFNEPFPFANAIYFLANPIGGNYGRKKNSSNNG